MKFKIGDIVYDYATFDDTILIITKIGINQNYVVVTTAQSFDSEYITCTTNTGQFTMYLPD